MTMQAENILKNTYAKRYTKKYNHLIYRILCSIPTHASGFIKTLPQTAAIFTHANSS